MEELYICECGRPFSFKGGVELCRQSLHGGSKVNLKESAAPTSSLSSIGLEGLFDFLKKVADLKVHDCNNNNTIFNTDKWIRASDLRKIVEKLSDHLKEQAD